jgi:hypothetical protein
MKIEKQGKGKMAKRREGKMFVVAKPNELCKRR